jgi:hypothetical protein
MRQWLAREANFPVIGRFFREEWAVYLFAYSALLFDLCIVPLLLWRRTRLAAFVIAIAFHLLNAKLFQIGIFPWLAIAATTLFLSPDWPRRLISIFKKQPAVMALAEPASVSPIKRRLVLAFVLLYVTIQVLVPLRPFLYRGGIEWQQAEHRFTWRMMLIGRWERVYFYVIDPNSGQEYQATPLDYLTPWQEDRMQWQSDLLLQFAHYLARVMPRTGPKPLRVEARVLVALNGRKPMLFIDPTVDLAAEEQHWGRPRWFREIHEPIPDKEDRSDPLQNPFKPPPED